MSMTNKEMAEAIHGYFSRRGIRSHVCYWPGGDYWTEAVASKWCVGKLGPALLSLKTVRFFGDKEGDDVFLEAHPNDTGWVTISRSDDGVMVADILIPPEDFERVFGE